MTPEERFKHIEELLNTMAGNHVLFHSEMQELKETQARQSEEIDKHAAAIRDLIILSRTFLDSQKEVTTQIHGLHAAQLITDEKLQALFDKIDRIIRDRNN